MTHAHDEAPSFHEEKQQQKKHTTEEIRAITANDHNNK